MLYTGCLKNICVWELKGSHETSEDINPGPYGFATLYCWNNPLKMSRISPPADSIVTFITIPKIKFQGASIVSDKWSTKSVRSRTFWTNPLFLRLPCSFPQLFPSTCILWRERRILSDLFCHLLNQLLLLEANTRIILRGRKLLASVSCFVVVVRCRCWRPRRCDAMPKGWRKQKMKDWKEKREG